MNFIVSLTVLGIIALPFVLLGFIFWLKSAEKRKLDKLQTDLYIEALEQGLVLPSDLFNKSNRTNRFLETRIVLISIGIGIALYLVFVSVLFPKFPIMRFAAMSPFFFGIGFLVGYFIWKKKR
jgi:hypothetical protein